MMVSTESGLRFLPIMTKQEFEANPIVKNQVGTYELYLQVMDVAKLAFEVFDQIDQLEKTSLRGEE